MFYALLLGYVRSFLTDILTCPSATWFRCWMRLWGSKTGYRLLTCGYGRGSRSRAGSIGGL